MKENNSGKERVMHQLLHQGRTFIVISDLIRDNLGCHIVLTWGDVADGSFPQVSIPIDRNLLVPLNDGVAEWMIENEVIESPRTFDGTWQ